MASTGTGTALTAFWLKFFTEAGIPPGDATNYAISFSDHRISQDMLMDLNKEILQDIGVTLMGDVIAVLKHAKSVHAQTARDKVLKGSSAMSPVVESGTSTPPRRSTPASRTVNHYLAADPEARPLTEPAPPKGSSISQEMACRLGPSPAQTVSTAVGGGTKKSSVFDRLGGEGSGAALGTSPEVTTKVTVTGLGKIIVGNKAGIQSAGIFDRLGGKKAIKRAATSTTDDLSGQRDAVEYAGVLKLGPSPAKKQRTGLQKITIKKTIEQRLGPKQSVLRTIGAKRPLVKVSAPKRPDSTSSGVLNMDVVSTQLKTPLRNRLGKTLITSPATSTAAAKKVTRTMTPKAGIRARLGAQKVEATSTSTPVSGRKKIALTTKKGGIFGRLGKQL